MQCGLISVFISFVSLLVEIRVFICDVTVYKSSCVSCFCGGDCGKISTGNGTIEHEHFYLQTLYIQGTTDEYWQSLGDRRRDNIKDFERETYLPKRCGVTQSSAKFPPEIRNLRK